MVQADKRRPFTAEASFRTRANPFGISDEQNGTGIDSSPSTSVFPFQYHSVTDPYSSSSLSSSSTSTTS